MERVLSGRTITESDIETMRYVAESYPALSRQESANTVCEPIGWTTPAGGPKSSQCMACFDALEAEGLVRTPALKKRKGKNRQTGYASARQKAGGGWTGIRSGRSRERRFTHTR